MNIKYFLIALLFNTLTYAQENTTFQVNKQFYIQGDAISIGNNILSKHKKKAFNEINSVNDQINMKYVDVDKDDSTFSSSSASIEMPQNNNEIVYAGLYWTAIYGYKKGVRRVNGNKIFFKGKGKRDDVFNIVKFKTPNADYKTVKGDVLFDGFGNEEFKESSPYVCYADVTHLINNTNIDGTYTVANIKATQGYTLGGSSAGWVLYVIYKNPNKSPKHITTYHGLADIANNKPLDIRLNQLKPDGEGLIDVSITMAALEGDINLKQDQSLIYNPENNTYIPLSNKIRNSKNFFNSSITTKENNISTNRVPNSINTLGFDLAQIEVPSLNNDLINNNTTETSLRFTTKSDRFYLFFTAFETKITQENYYLNQNEQVIASKDSIVSSPEVIAITDTKELRIKHTNTDKTAKANKNDKVVGSNQETMVKSTLQIPKEYEVLIEDINNSEGIESADLKRGYYVITNVFSKKRNADRWNALLIEKGYKTEMFINPKNNWYYISVFNTENIYQALQERSRLDALDYLNGIWVFKVNIDSPAL